MSDQSEALDILDDLLATLETSAEARKERHGGDAIAAVLNAPGRATRVRSLREAPEVEAFRQALVDGIVRADTVRQLLAVVNAVVTRLVA